MANAFLNRLLGLVGLLGAGMHDARGEPEGVHGCRCTLLSLPSTCLRYTRSRITRSQSHSPCTNTNMLIPRPRLTFLSQRSTP